MINNKVGKVYGMFVIKIINTYPTFTKSTLIHGLCKDICFKTIYSLLFEEFYLNGKL